MMRILIIFLILFNACGSKDSGTVEKPMQLDDGIQTASLDSLEINTGLIKAMRDSITAGIYPNIHSVLIVHNNKLVFEQYWPGHDEDRGTGFVGMRNHGRDSLHDVRSITKSIVSAAFMIAIAQGKIKDVNQRVFDYFPEYTRYDTGLKREIMIKHLLTMSAGMRWTDDDEFVFADSLKENNVSHAINFIFKQPMEHPPGAVFNYSAGCTQLLAVIIEKATGMNIEAFTAKYIFTPLGISHYEWTKEKNGLICAWGGLRMRSRDVLKFGMLYHNNGNWNGEQIIPAPLVKESTSTHIYVDPPYGYGYQFWTLVDTIDGKAIRTIEATGNGGQKIEINKEKNFLLVITAGNYDNFTLRKTPYDVYLDFVYPAIKR